MKRPWLLILMACVLGELPVLLWDIQWGVFALLFVLWLFLAGFAFGGSGIKKKTAPGAVLFLTVFCLAFTRGLLTRLFAGRGALLEGSALRKPVRHRFRVRDVKTGEKGVEIYGGGLVLFAGEAPDLWRGDLIEALGIPEEIPPPKNPGAFDQRSYYRGLGITFRMQAMEVRLLKKSLVPDVFLALRRFFSRRLYGRADEETAGFAAAVLLGDREGVSPSHYEAFQRHGLAHILAVSGLHVSFMGLALFRFLHRGLGLGYQKSGLAAGIFLFAFMELVGGVSVMRAGGMLLLLFFAARQGRTYDLISAASFMGTLFLFWEPNLLFHVGFQLSFASVFSIGLIREFLLLPLALEKPWAEGLIFSVGMQLFMLPLTLYYFFRIPSYAFLLNLLVIPLMGLVLFGSLLLCVFPVEALSFPFAGGVRFLLRFFLFLCEVAEKLPFSGILLGRPRIWQVFLYYGILLFWLWLFNKKHSSLKEKKRRFFYVLSPVFLVFLLFPLPKHRTEIIFFDVGQGDGIYLSVDGEDILVDFGSSSRKNPGKEILYPFLKSRGIDRLEKVCITHGDWDHTGGILWILEEKDDIMVDTLYLPLPARESPDYERIRRVCEKRGIPVAYIGAGDFLPLRKGEMICLSPEREKVYTGSNGESLVFLFTLDDFELLTMGDATDSEERAILLNEEFSRRLQDVDVIKIGHHGSFSSSAPEFIRHLSPAVGILSYGKKNTYGHPDKRVVRLFREEAVRLYHTPDSGAIMLETDGEKLWIREYRINRENEEIK